MHSSKKSILMTSLCMSVSLSANRLFYALLLYLADYIQCEGKY